MSPAREFQAIKELLIESRAAGVKEAVEQLSLDFSTPIRTRARRQQRAECYELRRVAYLNSHGCGDSEEAVELRIKIAQMRKTGAIARRTEVL